MNNKQIFNGLKVVELASVLAGPSVGQFFAELGANVIKVENPATNGDVTRSWKLSAENPDSDTSAYFASANWGKTHRFINLKTDLKEALALIKDSDIVICSFKPGDAEKLGVDYRSVQKINKNIIYGNISGYGEEDKRMGYDAVLQAEAGFMYMNGDPDGLPTKLPIALVDVVAAHQMKEGILTALLHKERTGQGSQVNVSLYESAITALVNQGTNYLNTGQIPERTGSDHPNIVPYGKVFRTADKKYMILAVGNDVQFKKLLQILNLTDAMNNPDFDTNSARVKNRERLNKMLENAIRDCGRKELLDALIMQKVPAAPVNNLEEVFGAEPAQNMVLEYDGEDLKGIRNVAFKLK